MSSRTFQATLDGNPVSITGAGGHHDGRGLHTAWQVHDEHGHSLGMLVTSAVEGWRLAHPEAWSRKLVCVAATSEFPPHRRGSYPREQVEPLTGAAGELRQVRKVQETTPPCSPRAEETLRACVQRFVHARHHDDRGRTVLHLSEGWDQAVTLPAAMAPYRDHVTVSDLGRILHEHGWQWDTRLTAWAWVGKPAESATEEAPESATAEADLDWDAWTREYLASVGGEENLAEWERALLGL